MKYSLLSSNVMQGSTEKIKGFLVKQDFPEFRNVKSTNFK